MERTISTSSFPTHGYTAIQLDFRDCQYSFPGSIKKLHEGSKSAIFRFERGFETATLAPSALPFVFAIKVYKDIGTNDGESYNELPAIERRHLEELALLRLSNLQGSCVPEVYCRIKIRNAEGRFTRYGLAIQFIDGIALFDIPCHHELSEPQLRSVSRKVDKCFEQISAYGVRQAGNDMGNVIYIRRPRPNSVLLICLAGMTLLLAINELIGLALLSLCVFGAGTWWSYQDFDAVKLVGFSAAEFQEPNKAWQQNKAAAANLMRQLQRLIDQRNEQKRPGQDMVELRKLYLNSMDVNDVSKFLPARAQTRQRPVTPPAALGERRDPMTYSTLSQSSSAVQEGPYFA